MSFFFLLLCSRLQLIRFTISVQRRWPRRCSTSTACPSPKHVLVTSDPQNPQLGQVPSSLSLLCCQSVHLKGLEPATPAVRSEVDTQEDGGEELSTSGFGAGRLISGHSCARVRGFSRLRLHCFLPLKQKRNFLQFLNDVNKPLKQYSPVLFAPFPVLFIFKKNLDVVKCATALYKTF